MKEKEEIFKILKPNKMSNPKFNSDKKIAENWKTIEEMEKAAAKQTGDPEARFNAGTFFFGGGRHLMIPIKYRGKKGKKGQETFTKSYKDLMTFAVYCPFTGKPLYEEYKPEEK